MPKERRLVMEVLRAFISSLKPRMSRRKLVGEDYNGTKYYEDPEARAQRGRSFIPIDKNDFMQEIPAEWEAWLRYRRREPPAKEEVDKNYNLMLMKKINAEELDKKYAAEMGEKNRDGKSLTVAPEKVPFPTYKEYEDFGRGNKN